MWEWLDKARQFIDRAINKVLGREDVESLIVKNQRIYTEEVDRITSTLLADEIGVDQWELGMRGLIKEHYIQMYLLGRGGRGNMARADYSSIGGMLGRDQYAYLRKFADAIANGELTPGQILARSRMYVRSSREAFNRALGRAWGIPEGALPAYPGDGRSCLGLTNCGCEWIFEENDEVWFATWSLGETEHCEVCIENSKTWNPYVIPKPGVA
jgi:hypothetical protein